LPRANAARGSVRERPKGRLTLALTAVAAVILTLAVNAGYGLPFLPWRDASPPEVWREMQAGADSVRGGRWYGEVEEVWSSGVPGRLLRQILMSTCPWLLLSARFRQ